MKKAVIVAAGRSTRLHPLTLKKPKSLLEIAGESLLSRSLRLLGLHGITDIAVVIGFEGEQIRAAIGDRARCIVNPYYPLCNNMGSLWFARDFVGAEPFLYLHADVIFDEKILDHALSEFARCSQDDLHLVTDFGPVDEEAMKVRITSEHLLVESSKEIPLQEAAGEWIGMTLTRNPASLFQTIERKLLEGEYTSYDTSAFNFLAAHGSRLRCTPTRGLPWKEIDFLSDLEAARALFEVNRD